MKHLLLLLLPLFAFGQTDSLPFNVPPQPPPPLQLTVVSSSVRDQGKLLVVLSQPNDKKKREHYIDYWNDYIESHPNDRYLNGKPVYYYYMYLAKWTEDTQWLKDNGIPTDKNLYAVCDYEGEVMYYREASIPEMHHQKLFYDDTEAEVRTTAVARLMDKVLPDPEAPIENVAHVFHKMLTNNYDLQLPNVKNYTLKTTPQQVIQQWKRLVDSHYRDRVMNEDYTRLLIRNYSLLYNENFLQTVFGGDYTPDATDLKAIAYFIKFYEEAGTVHDAEALFLNSYDISQLLDKIQTDHRELQRDIEAVRAEAKRKGIIVDY